MAIKLTSSHGLRSFVSELLGPVRVPRLLAALVLKACRGLDNHPSIARLYGLAVGAQLLSAYLLPAQRFQLNVFTIVIIWHVLVLIVALSQRREQEQLARGLLRWEAASLQCWSIRLRWPLFSCLALLYLWPPTLMTLHAQFGLFDGASVGASSWVQRAFEDWGLIGILSEPGQLQWKSPWLNGVANGVALFIGGLLADNLRLARWMRREANALERARRQRLAHPIIAQVRLEILLKLRR